MNTVLFLGRLHVLVLHLPLGILSLAAVLEVLVRRPRFAALAAAMPAIWFAGALSALVTVAMGFMHAQEGGFDGGGVLDHKIAGCLLAALACAAWLLRAWSPRSFIVLRWPVIAGVGALMVVTGHLGGNLTHGATYLTQYAPGPLRKLLGQDAESDPRPAVTSLGAADVYLDVVAPALRQRCLSCHNDDKKRGGLSVANYVALMAGGKAGPVILPGKPAESDLIRRVQLPPDHKDAMPQDHKPPLSDAQISVIQWWIASGAPRTHTFVGADAAVEIAASSVLGLSTNLADASAQVHAESADSLPVADPRDIAAAEARGFRVRSVAAERGALEVDFASSTRKIEFTDLEALGLLKDQLVDLNLRDAGVSDKDLLAIGQLTNLLRLRLELNPITGQGLKALTGLQQLQYINLFGTLVAGDELTVLANLPRLRNIYAWQTKVSESSAKEIRSRHAQLNVILGGPGSYAACRSSSQTMRRDFSKQPTGATVIQGMNRE